MALDPAAKRLLDMLAVMRGAADLDSLSPRQLRESFRQLARSVDIKNVPIGKVENGQWPGPAGALPYRGYYPAPSAAGLPALVYFHGGGGIFGEIDTHDGLCRSLAAESGCAVISIGYRQAPEHKFPAAVEDSYAATCWASDNALALGIDARRIAIGGDSAGGGSPRSSARLRQHKADRDWRCKCCSARCLTWWARPPRGRNSRKAISSTRRP